MTDHKVVANNFLQANLINLKDSVIKSYDDYSEVTITLDQTSLSTIGLNFITPCHKQFIRPLVVRSKIIDSKNQNSSYYYASNAIQSIIDNGLDDSIKQNSVVTNITINTLDLNDITKLFGVIQVVEMTIRF